MSRLVLHRHHERDTEPVTPLGAAARTGGANVAGRSVILLTLIVVVVSGPVSVAIGQTPGDLEDRVSRLESEVQDPDLERRVSALEGRVQDAAETGMVLFLFGAFCALWAQNRGRSGLAWFVAGAFFNVITVLVLLAINGREVREERLRRARTT